MNHYHWIFNVQTFWFAYCVEQRIIHVRVLTNRFTIYISNMNKRVSINYRFI